MNRILIAVGCDQYDFLSALHGAERDASAVYDQLTEPNGDYTAASSLLLRSPSIDEIVSALSKLPFGSGDISTLTFFFAGHGGHKSGTYYLCARDTHPARLSTSGLAVSRILSVITELRPLQANVIIDACQSGGAMLDSVALLRADALGLGSPGSLGLAFLAACGPNEYAAETSNGGELTNSILSYIRGDATLQTTRPYLDLIDLGRRVSSELSEKKPDQVPVSWGINLTGEGHFVSNRRYAPATEELAMVASVLASGSLKEETRRAMQGHTFALWRQHLEVEVEVEVAPLWRRLRALVADLGEDKPATARVLRGLATSLRASAVKSSDVFAESLVLFSCAVPLLSLLDDVVAAQAAQQILGEALQAQAHARSWLLKELKRDRYCLLSDGNGIADLYYLPLRLSRILGCLAAGLEIARLLGRTEPGAASEVRNIAELLLERYAPSLTPRSDAQSPFVLIFAEVARRHGWTEVGEQIIGCYFNGFVEAAGVIARPDLTADDAFTFALGLGQSPEHVEHHLRANPTQFLAVLLACGAALGMDDDWDPELSRLDHHTGYLFIPSDYAHFDATVIERGKNFLFQIGHDVFTMADFRAFIQSHVVGAMKIATRDLSPPASSLALVASCLEPDRLPAHLLDLDAIVASPSFTRLQARDASNASSGTSPR